MISFYGGPNGIQGEQGIQGEKGDSFNIVDFKIEDNYSFSEEDKIKYNSDKGTWLGVYSTNTNFNIMQYQTKTKEVQSFLLGTLSQPLWYKIQNDILIASNDNIYLTRDNSNNLVEGQLDFSIDNDKLKISTKIDGVDKIYESPVPYELDNENGYLTSNDVKQDQIGDIKLRALEDDGSLTKDGEWVETNKQVEIKREESAPFFDILDYTNSKIVDAGVYSAISQDDFNEALKEYRNFGLEQAYTKFLNSPVGYNNNDNYFCGFFELAENSLIIFLYYDKNFEIQYITPFYRIENEGAYDFWVGEISLEETHILSFNASGKKFKYSFFSNPKSVTEIVSDNSFYKFRQCYFKKKYLIIFYESSSDYDYIQKITLATGQITTYHRDKTRTGPYIGFIGDSLIVISCYSYGKEYDTRIVNLTTDLEIASSNFMTSEYIIGFTYQNKNYFVSYSFSTGLIFKGLYEIIGSSINEIAIPKYNFYYDKRHKRGLTLIINDEYLVIDGYYILLSDLINLIDTTFKSLPINFYDSYTSAYLIGDSLFYSYAIKVQKLRNFENDFYPTMQKVLYTPKKVSNAEYEYLKIK